MQCEMWGLLLGMFVAMWGVGFPVGHASGLKVLGFRVLGFRGLGFRVLGFRV